MRLGAATESLYPTAADRVNAATAINASPGVVALYGPIGDPHSLGELSMTKMTVLYAVFVALLFAVIVRRHTRLEEESGQAELLGGTALGRDAVLAASWAESLIVAGVLWALATLACVSGGLPVAGSIAFAGSWAGVGLFSASFTAVACQLSASARTCAAIAAATIGGLFLIRAVKDTTEPWLSWLSPFGWSTKLQVLATASSPVAVFWATVVVAVVGSTWILALSGVAIGLGFGLADGHLASALASTVPAALVQAPAVWLVTALAVAAYSLRSSWSIAGWGLVAGFLTLGQLGELLRLPEKVIQLSPYVHSPRMPVEPFSSGAPIVLGTLAALLMMLASEGFRLRDID